MAKIIYNSGKLFVTGSDTFNVTNTISGSKDLFFSASVGPSTYHIVTIDTGSGKLYHTSSADVFSISSTAAGSNNEVQFNNGGALGASSNFTFDGSTLTVTGDISVSGDLSAKGPNKSIQFNDGGNFSGSSEMTYDKSTGDIRISSSASPSITSILTETDSFSLIQNVPTTGPAYRMDLADADTSGSATMMLGRQSGGFTSTGFFAKYTTGSNASEGEITMAIGKNGSASTGITERFIVQSEPGPIATNGDSELTLSVGGPSTGRREVLGTVNEAASGEFAQFAAGIDKQFNRKRFVGFEYSAASTSSQAGFYSSSLNGTGVGNFNTNAVPFGITAGGSGTEDLTNTVFYIDRGGSLGASVPVTASLEIARDGSIKTDGRLIFRSDITNEISASGRLNITTTGDQIALKADGTQILLKAGGDNTVLSVQSSSFSTGPGTFNRVIATGAILAEDGHVSTMDTSSLRESPAASLNQLDHRGHVLTKVGGPGTGASIPKGAIVALTGSNWSIANSGSGACASSSLAVNLTTGQSQGPFLMQGIVNLSYAPGDRVGQLLYLGDNGSASAVPPTNGAHYSLPVGYYLGANTMYFSPDRTTGGADNVTATTNTPAGSDTQIQFNDNGAFGASSALTFNTNALTLTGNFTASGAVSASGIGTFGGDVTAGSSGNGFRLLASSDGDAANATFTDISSTTSGLSVHNDTANLVQGSNAKVTVSGSRLGIGTQTPGESLTVNAAFGQTGAISASGLLYISASENAGQAYRVLVRDLATGRVYYTGSYADTSPYIHGLMEGDIQPKLGNNITSGSFSTIGGGQDNVISGSNAFIGAGSSSLIEGGKNNFIAGGQDNIISGSDNNFIAGLSNVITQDNNNAILGSGNTIIGGGTYHNNFIAGADNSLSFGRSNVITGANNTVTTEAFYYRVGGYSNTIASIDNTSNNPGGIFSGRGNTLGETGASGLGHGQIIVGGLNNTNAGRLNNSIILTGQENTINDSTTPTNQDNQGFHSIFNGLQNQITGSATVGGSDAAKDRSGRFSTIINGEGNRIQTGGAASQTVYKYNTIMNGTNNLVSGSGNTGDVSGLYNTIVNGDNNIIGPDVSGSTIAAGSNITADRSDTVFAANLSLTNLPTSDTGLPVGAVYRDGTTLKIVV